MWTCIASLECDYETEYRLFIRMILTLIETLLQKAAASPSSRGQGGFYGFPVRPGRSCFRERDVFLKGHHASITHGGFYGEQTRDQSPCLCGGADRDWNTEKSKAISMSLTIRSHYPARQGTGTARRYSTRCSMSTENGCMPAGQYLQRQSQTRSLGSLNALKP